MVFMNTEPSLWIITRDRAEDESSSKAGFELAIFVNSSKKCWEKIPPKEQINLNS